MFFYCRSTSRLRQNGWKLSGGKARQVGPPKIRQNVAQCGNQCDCCWKKRVYKIPCEGQCGESAGPGRGYYNFASVRCVENCTKRLVDCCTLIFFRVADPTHLIGSGFSFSLKCGSGSSFSHGSGYCSSFNDGNMRTIVYRPSNTTFWASKPPLWVSTDLHGSIWASKLLNFVVNADRIRFQLSKQCRSAQTGSAILSVILRLKLIFFTFLDELLLTMFWDAWLTARWVKSPKIFKYKQKFWFWISYKVSFSCCRRPYWGGKQPTRSIP